MSTLMEDVAARRRQTIPPAVARAIRQGAGVTQAAIAAELGVTPETVYRLECGTRRPGPAHRAAYAALLNALRDLS